MLVRRLRPDEGRRLRDVRLRRSPMPRSRSVSSLEEERGFPAEYWQSLADDTQTADRRLSAVAEEQCRLVGIVGDDFRSDERAAPPRRVVG
jgi:hypothetical protein